MRWALLGGDGVVVNVIVWDSGAPYTTVLELVELEPGSPVGPGWTRVDDEWVAPLVEEYI